MAKIETKKNTGVVLNLSKNTEKEAILKAIIASGEFDICETEGVVTLYVKQAAPQKQHTKLVGIAKMQRQGFVRIGLSKPKKHIGILERVAKSQDIALASADSLDAVCSGVIV